MTFTISTLRCACGSSEIISIDPGRDAEMDPVFDIVIRRPILARGWCAKCVDAFVPLMPHEDKKMPKPVLTGWIRRDGINVVGEIEDAWGWKIYLHGVPGIKDGIPAFILTCPLGETPDALRIEAIDGPRKA